MEESPLLFLAGIPCSGKTHFGQWLEGEHGYLHIDAEVQGELDRVDLREVWETACANQDCSALAAALRARGAPAIFNWGFPPACLPVAAALKRAGFSSWWFAGDHAAARREHALLGRSTEDFDIQWAAIQSQFQQIAALFHPNIVTVLGAKGERMTPQEILQRIQGG